jgi:hypothetical protein
VRLELWCSWRWEKLVTCIRPYTDNLKHCIEFHGACVDKYAVYF